MDKIALLPGFFAAFFAFFYTPERAFMSVYLPCLLLIPNFYRADIQGLPDLNFNKAAVFPIFLALIIRKKINTWNLSLCDFLVLGYLFCIVYSEYTADLVINEYTTEKQLMHMSNGNYSLAQNLLSNKLLSVFFPYVLAKYLIHPKHLTIPVAKRLVFIAFIIVLISVYEMRMTLNLFNFAFDPFFGDQGRGWGKPIRFGFVRIAGPFGHPILLGIMLMVALLFNYWLFKNKVWKLNFKYLPRLPLPKGSIISFVILFGILMTFSRGPLLSGIFGAIIVGIGLAKNRWKSLFGRSLILLGFVIFIASIFNYYSEINTELATGLEQSAAYRTKIIKEYTKIVMKKPYWGWGLTLWPILPNLKSIDNHYLFLALNHGLVTLGAFLILVFVTCMRLFIRGMTTPRENKLDSSLAFTFLATYIAISLVLGTVYMGLQIEPLFFLITGWAEGFLMSKPVVITKGFVSPLQYSQSTMVRA